ncbi:GH25 family lysozyme [Micromonospora sp. NPDC049559]|uniref:GH25 family lysozyme n=1 Tax=Micromonospora sp. NPDC049559 TaxID=3155923 RepID=UPI00343F58B6
MRLWRGIAAVAVAAAVLGIPAAASAAEATGPATGAEPAAPGAVPLATTIPGIDVSAYQNPINWTSVRNSGQAFAIVKATESTTYTSSRFAIDYAQAASVGMIRGAYHFARPDSGANDALLEARYFVGVAGTFGTPGELPPALDLEANAGLSVSQLQNWVQTWLDEVERLTGRVPMIYTNVSNWKNWMGNSTAFARYPLWIAQYGVSAPSRIGGWSSYTFWQYTDTASVPGIAGNVDGDRFNGSSADLLALARGGGAGPCGLVTLNRTAYPDLRQGGTDTDAVCAVQTLLRGAGQTVPLDGNFDTGTAAAVSAFQGANGVYGGATGVVDRWTWTALLAHGASYPTLRSGSSGEAVVRLQRALTAALGVALDQDGIFGPATTAAVKSYQTSYSPPSDGIVGDGTWGHLRQGR